MLGNPFGEKAKQASQKSESKVNGEAMEQIEVLRIRRKDTNESQSETWELFLTNERQANILDALIANRRMNITRIAKVAKMRHETALATCNILVERGLLKQRVNNPMVQYEIPANREWIITTRNAFYLEITIRECAELGSKDTGNVQLSYFFADKNYHKILRVLIEHGRLHTTKIAALAHLGRTSV